jgi:hypothetical protein
MDLTGLLDLHYLKRIVLAALIHLDERHRLHTQGTNLFTEDTDMIGELEVDLTLVFGHYDDARDALGMQVGEGWIPGGITTWMLDLSRWTSPAGAFIESN